MALPIGANCASSMFQDIKSTCLEQKTGGMEVRAWVIPRRNLEATRDTTNPILVTAIEKVTGTKAYKAIGVKKLFNAGHDSVSAENRADRYIHHFMLEQFETDAAATFNGDALNDLVVFYERKDKALDGDGDFVILGLNSGLYKVSDTERVNDANGARLIELASMGGQEEPHSKNILLLPGGYAATLAALVALETA